MKVVHICEHPKIRSREKREAEIEWLREYHAAHPDSQELTERQIELLHAGMLWLMRNKITDSLQDAYQKALLGI